MKQTRVCRSISAVDIWATMIASVLVLAVLLYFDVEATIHLVRKDANHQLSLAVMAISFLMVAQIACIYWIRIRNNCPREIELLEKYLNKGKIVIGDVHYPANQHEQVGCCSCNSNSGTVIYRHPMSQYKGCFVRKQVILIDKYSRELETMLILPGEPFSAQPKAEIQGLLAITRKRNEIVSVLEWYGLGFFVFCLLSTAYLLFAMTLLDTSQDDPLWQRYLGWIVYAAALVIIPFVALVIANIKWNAYLEMFKRGQARLVQDDDDEYSTFTHLPGGVRDNMPKQEV